MIAVFARTHKYKFDSPARRAPRPSRGHRLRVELLEERALLAGLAAAWVGQQGSDFVGLGPNVGPDGFIDAEISLSGLKPGAAVASIRIDAAGGASWEFGKNHGAVNNAEFVANSSDSTAGVLYIGPAADPDLAGRLLTLSIQYSDFSRDSATVAAGTVDYALKAPSPPPASVQLGAITAEWKGQDGSIVGGAGAVHVRVTNIPTGRTVVGGMLTDSVGLSWAFGTSNGSPLSRIDPSIQPLSFQLGADPTTADLGFGPSRDETGSIMTLRLILDDGSSVVGDFAGGAADPSLRFPPPDSTTYYATPGDSLHSLVNQYGTVHLAAGTYVLDSPLILNRAVVLVGDPGAVLLFQQPAGSPAWTAAIKIHASNTTLDGFTVRFAGPIEWAPNISYGPAVVGATDNYDVGFYDPLVNLVFQNLDLQSPPASSTDWEEAVRLFRLANAQSGTIQNNTLKGGTTEFFNGPWLISGNTYHGTPPHTVSYGVFAGHYTHDVRIIGNTIQGSSESSKTWRFAVLTQASVNDVIADNVVSGVGPKDDDVLPNPNAPETILTEAYRLHFEGAPSAVSPDGMVVQIPYLQEWIVRTGDVLSILEGPEAGQWRRIRQALSATSFLLDRPIDPATPIVSIATGVVDLTVADNLIDSRGSSVSMEIVLAGNLFNASVHDNQIIGGRRAIWIYGSPTEAPNIWGWSHTPVLDFTVRDNLMIDSIEGAVINVEHGIYVKTNLGRVYMTGAVLNNQVVWSQEFVDRRAATGSTPTGLQIGNDWSLDPGEAWLTLDGESYLAQPGQSQAPAMVIASAMINGVETVGRSVPMQAEAAAVADLRLVRDDGADPHDRITSDGRITFDPISTALKYEYSLTGSNGSFTPVSLNAGSGFTPQGLAVGWNTIYVRALDGFGITRGTSSLSFRMESPAPPVPAGLRLVADSGWSSFDLETNDPRLTFTPVEAVEYEYSLSGAEGSYQPIAFGSGAVFLAPGLVAGWNTVYVRAVDAAGNRSDSVAITFRYDPTPPGAPDGLRLVVDSGLNSGDGTTNDGRVEFTPTADAAWYEYSLIGAEWTYAPVALGPGAEFLPAGLMQGINTVYIRAVDAAGNRSAPSVFSFVYDTTPPPAVPMIAARANGQVVFSAAEAGATYQYRIGANAPFQDLGSMTRFRVAAGDRRLRIVSVRAVDAAGNAGPVRRIVVRPLLLRSLARFRRAIALKFRPLQRLRIRW